MVDFEKRISIFFYTVIQKKRIDWKPPLVLNRANG